MLDYEKEAVCYDRTRGGEPRAAAAAEAVLGLIPGGAEVVVDVGCGTGIVTARLRGDGRRVVGVDRAAGMLGFAVRRLGAGNAVLADAGCLPFADGSCDVVVTVWLLHLVGCEEADRILAECARVLRPGGGLVSTVDKDLAFFETGSDVTEVIARHISIRGTVRPDGAGRIGDVLAGLDMMPAGEGSFRGAGQGRSPLVWRDKVGRLPWGVDDVESVRVGLAALPDQEVPRPDPVYRIRAFVKRR
ncbi:class I SAM-dependent methyltransferase [Actinomadura montaniterrae]|uniref:Class I SAM-dependent methyltransferase n=1 Tax=Actinomadura montaniterrae TaxID=1803903 RepID=A0A6L3W4A5_9ACTN|nr:class I SAM-dependent methyltransferase [Actinomadura montaniterrae]KAB2387795.1 class I SAM-dependent methyltransferase [Actinomadura montaniterrae]